MIEFCVIIEEKEVNQNVLIDCDVCDILREKTS